MENINIKRDDSNDEMNIKIQTFENIAPLTIKRNASVQELKDKIFECFNIPMVKQRLIFQGKLLQNTEKLRTYKISDESVIHLVAKSMEENPNNNNNQGESQGNTLNQTGNQSENSAERINIEEIFPTLVEFPVIRSNRRQRRRRVPHFDISECFESMHQNLSTMQNLVNCRGKYDESQTMQSKTIVAYDLTKSKYEVGQWVDVKDTIDQWLEAQVIQVRNNQAYVHYNGWGVRWDEWIDFSSPRMAPFKTYTMQSPASNFLSPYPHVACDANVEPQPRSIDSFFYMEKSANYMSELIRTIEFMSKLRKKNANRTFEDKKQIKKDDFEEGRDKENQSRNFTNNPNLNSFNINTNDYELLFNMTQIIPLMDRCGRLLSDVSLQLSHLILNPNLYPQLLLGYNQNIEVSDTLSCTSGYSMYTNESSTLSGFNQLLQFDQNILNNLQNTRSNILNSNQMINNYTNANIIHQGQGQSNVNTANANLIYQQGQSNVNTANPNLIHQQGQSNVNTANTSNAYNLNSSSNELPFINRLQATNVNTNTNQVSNTQSNFDSFPKINLQIPSMLSPGEVVLYNGYNPYMEPNIDIYVHTLVTSNNTNVNNSNVNSNTGNINPNANSTNIRNDQNLPNTNVGSTLPRTGSDSDLIGNVLNANTLQQGGQTTTTSANTTTANSGQLGNLLENLMTFIGRNPNQTSHRRGSVTSDTSSTSAGRPGISSSLMNTGTGINPNNPFFPPQTNSSNNIQGSLLRPTPVQRMAQNTNRTTNQSNPLSNVASLYRESSAQTDSALNLLSLQKDQNYSDNMMELISNKSDKNMSLKNKNTVSYKSVSEISEFEEYDQEEPPSEFPLRTKTKKSVVSQQSRLNESIHSINSHVSNSKNEDKEEEDPDHTRKDNKP